VPQHIKILKRFLIPLLILYPYILFSQEIPQYDLSSGGGISLFNWKYHFGGDSGFASPDFADSSWSPVNTENFTTRNKGIHLYRKQLNFTGVQNDYDFISLAVYYIPSAYELYWDGTLITENGKVGSSEQYEIPGNSIQKITLKREFTQPGIHTIAIKCSNYNIAFFTRKFISINFGYKSDLENIYNDSLKQNLIFSGGFIAATFISLMLYFGSSKNKSYLILFLIFFVNSVNYLCLFIFVSKAISYILYSYLDILSLILTNTSNFLILIFLLYNFELPKKAVHIAVFTGIILLENFLNYFPPTEKYYYELLTITYMLIIIFSENEKRRKQNCLTGFYLFSFIFCKCKFAYSFSR
jgi:hypothetical protein